MIVKRSYVLLRLAPWSLPQMTPWQVTSHKPWEAPWRNPVIEIIKQCDLVPGKTLDSFGVPLDDPIFRRLSPMLGSYLAGGLG